MQRPEPEIISDNLRRAALIALVASVLPAVVVLIIGVLVVPWYVAVVVALAVGGLLWWRRSSTAEARILAAVGAVPVDERVHARLRNLVEGLCIQAGVKEPALFVIDDGAINALVVGRDEAHASIAVTRGAFEQLNRVELEGVLAQLLAQIRAGDTAPRTAAVAHLGWIAKLSSPWYLRLIDRVVDVDRRFRNDATGVSITRYPPGLARALEKTAALTAEPATAPGSVAHLWMVAPRPSSLSHPPTETRIEALGEL